MRPRTTFVLSVLLMNAGTALADDTPKPRYVVPQSGALRASPAGELSGNLRRGVPVMAFESDGDWVHVTADGWMRANELADHEPSAQSAEISAQLKVTAFSILPVERDKKSDPLRVLLKLQVQNTSAQPVAGWSGVLTCESKEGKAVLRTPLEGGAIAPHATSEFNFYYEDGEKEYPALSAHTGDAATLTVNLFSVKLK